MNFFQNKLKEQGVFNEANINKDFDIYVFENSASYFKNNFLKTPDLQIASCAYTWGAKWYAMFAKNTDISALQLDEQTSAKKITFEEIEYFNIKAILMLNLLAFKLAFKEFSNTFGRLYKFVDKKSNTIRFLKFCIDYENTLYMALKTFSKTASQNRQIVYFDENTHALSHIKKPNYEPYSQHSFGKTELNFLDISSLEKFQKSKLGMLNAVLEQAKALLKDYYSIEFEPLDETSFVFCQFSSIKDYESSAYGYDLNKEKSFKNLQEQLFECYLKINLSEHVKTHPAARQIINKISPLFSSDEDDLELCLNIIAPKEFYEQNALDDEYLSSLEVQNLTLDDELSEQEISAICNKIIQELLIKKDLITKKLSLCKDGDICAFLPHKRNKLYELFGMKVATNISFQNASESLVNNFRKLCDKSSPDCLIKHPNKPALIFYYKNIAVLISKTERILMPQPSALAKRLKAPACKHLTSSILEHLQASSDELAALEELAALREFLSSKYQISGEEIWRFLTNTSPHKLPPNSRLLAQIENRLKACGVIIHAHIKSKEYLDFYTGQREFFAFEENGVLKYCVGAKAPLQSRFAKAAHAYRCDFLCQDLSERIDVSDEVKRQVLRRIFELCSVRFVRSNQPSVLPWPAKYLREKLGLKASDL